MMNKKTAISIIGAAMALAGCSDKELSGDIVLGITPKSLTVNTTSVNFGANDNLTATLPVKAQNLAWNIDGEPSWLTVAPKQGNQNVDVALTAQENTSVDEARVGVLSLTAAEMGIDRQIAVNQQQAAIVLTPSATSISAKAASSVQSIAVTSNVEWTASCSDTWLTLERSGSTLNVTIAENLGASRSTTIHLKRTGTDTTLATIQVVQGEAGVTGSTEQLTFDVNGEVKTYSFSADASWTATTSDASWLTVSPTGGGNSVKSVTITALPNMSANERSGFIYIKIGTATKLEIPVKQSAIEMGIDVTSLSFGAQAGSHTANITSNIAWQVLDKPEWITVSPSSGAIGTSAVQFSAAENTDTSPRYGKVLFAILNGKNSFLSVDVQQAAMHLPEIPNTLNVSSYAQSILIDIKATDIWSVTTNSSSWIQVSPTDHVGDGTLEISIAENNDDATRTGTVTVSSAASGNHTVTINQEGKTFTVDCTDVIKSANACTVTVNVTSNVNWTVASEAAWLTPSRLEGFSNGTVNVAVSFNPSINRREGTLLFNATGKPATRFTFSQPGRTLSVDTELIAISSKGGESQVVTVIADGEFEVTSSDSWITVNRQPGANTFTVSVTELTSEIARSGKVEIRLTGVPSGEDTVTRTVKVTQAFTSIDLGGFGDEEDWD